MVANFQLGNNTGRTFVTGTIVNTIAILVGSLAGLVFRKGIPAKYNATIMQAIGLAVLPGGPKTALNSAALRRIIICMAAGSIWGSGCESKPGWKPWASGLNPGSPVRTVVSQRDL